MKPGTNYLAALVLLIAMGAAMNMEAQDSKITPQDAAEIRVVVDAMQTAWNHHDMKAFCDSMTEDVEWVNVVGMWWRGKPQVYKAHYNMHQVMFKDRELHDPSEILMREIAPGVVIVTQVIPSDGYTTGDGTKVPPNRNVLTETFVRRDGRWLVAEGHNTVIDERAQAHDPGR